MHTFTTRLTRSALGILLIWLAFGQPVQAQQPDRFEPNIVAFEKADQKKFPEKGGILFLGSSSVVRWDTDAGFPERNVLNRGFGGSQIEHQLRHMDRVIWKYEPRIILFYCGDNDINAGKSPSRVLEDFQKYRERVAERLPETDFIYLSIKPSVRRWNLWDNMATVNEAIREQAQTDGKLHYCDVATPMLENKPGPPSDKWFVRDGLHLSDEGYELWNNIVEACLKKVEQGTD